MSVIHNAQQEFQLEKKVCSNHVSEEYLEGYCAELTSEATTVSELETLWTIDDEPGFYLPQYVFYECVKQYCEEKFDEAWTSYVL